MSAICGEPIDSEKERRRQRNARYQLKKKVKTLTLETSMAEIVKFVNVTKFMRELLEKPNDKKLHDLVPPGLSVKCGDLLREITTFLVKIEKKENVEKIEKPGKFKGRKGVKKQITTTRKNGKFPESKPTSSQDQASTMKREIDNNTEVCYSVTKKVKVNDPQSNGTFQEQIRPDGRITIHSPVSGIAQCSPVSGKQRVRRLQKNPGDDSSDESSEESGDDLSEKSGNDLSEKSGNDLSEKSSDESDNEASQMTLQRNIALSMQKQIKSESDVKAKNDKLSTEDRLWAEFWKAAVAYCRFGVVRETEKEFAQLAERLPNGGIAICSPVENAENKRKVNENKMIMKKRGELKDRMIERWKYLKKHRPLSETGCECRFKQKSMDDLLAGVRGELGEGVSMYGSSGSVSDLLRNRLDCDFSGFDFSGDSSKGDIVYNEYMSEIKPYRWVL